MRYFLRFAYDGGAYHGWQVQPNAITVQQVMEEKLQILLQYTTPIVASGRTDAGVHASEQWAHFEVEAELPENFIYRLNCLLPDDIGVFELYAANNDKLHARFDAERRQYRYVVARSKDPIIRNHSLLHTGELNAEAMQEAASILLSHTEFASLCKAGGDNQTTLCTIYHSAWEFGEEVWVYRVGANRFLRGMVRAIVGTMLQIGRGDYPAEKLNEILSQKDRSAAGPAAPPEGLFLEKVSYPDGSLIRL